MPDVTEAQRAVFCAIETETRRRKAPDRPFVLGITGVDCAGKTEFAAGLGACLQERGHRIQVIHLDDFNNPRSVRRGGDDRDELYYQRIKQGYSFNWDRLVDELLRPIRENGRVTRRLVSVSWHDDDLTYETDYEVTPETVVLLEGVFLFLEVISRYVDYYVYLEISPDERRKRASARDPEDAQKSYERKYLPAFREFIEEYPPDRFADLVVDNTDWRSPRLK
jgi:uridine kinase